jgi:4-amino-4-deoxy-L-arabinose transferase-like glycosyltransferase
MIPVNDPETSSLPLRAEEAPTTAVADQARSHSAGARWLPEACAALVAVVSLLVPLSWSGLWAPYELETAELSRRIAHALHGAQALALEGANNTVPTLAELGRGQLPFSSVALGFQLFGLQDWAGRLPLALWGLLGIAATFALVARLSDRVAAAYASIALACMPLYFLQARTLLGDIVALSAVALACAGLGLGIFAPGTPSRGMRAGSLVLAVVGLSAGFASRGVLLGVATPALGVGLGWLACRAAGRRSRDRFAEVLGWACVGLGMVALGLGLWALLSAEPALCLELLGASLSPPNKLPTHDAVLHQLGFGLFPWSALAPFALAMVLGQDEDSALGVCLVSVFGVGLALHGLSAAYVGSVPFVATFALAAAIGLAFRRAELAVQNTRLVALGAAALLIIFAFDLRSYPEEALLPFVVKDAVFPESFTESAKSWIKYGAAPCLALLALALAELPPPPREKQPEPAGEWLRWLRGLNARWGGWLVKLLGAITLVLAVVPVLRFLQSRGTHITLLERLGEWARPLGYAYLIVPAAVLSPLAFFLARDLYVALLQLLARLPLPRPRLGVMALSGFGLALSLGYYPALAAQLSPRDVFEAFRQRSQSGEPLAVLGQASRVAPYYAGAAVSTPDGARQGFDWLMAAPEQRRWLVLGSRDLGQLNSLYREHGKLSANLPILDATSSEVLLASSRLAPGERNVNPLDAWLSREPPTPEHPLDVDLGQLRCLGWALTDPEGQRVEHVKTGVRYDFRIYWEVLEPLGNNWKTFIHIDGKGRRYNGDHETLEGKYPLKYWQKGDFVTDVHHFQFEPHFAGATYQVYFGLFVGDRRLSVRRGDHNDDRILGGTLVID